jgi:hypothetical protein
MFPVAANIAAEQDMDVKQVVFLLMLAASASFASPFGYVPHRTHEMKYCSTRKYKRTSSKSIPARAQPASTKFRSQRAVVAGLCGRWLLRTLVAVNAGGCEQRWLCGEHARRY